MPPLHSRISRPIAPFVLALILAAGGSAAHAQSESGFISTQPPRAVPSTGGGAPVSAARVRPSSEDLPLGVATPAAPTSNTQQAPASPASLFRSALALGSVLALIVLLAGVLRWLSKKGALKTVMGSIAHGAPAPSGVLEVLARFPMGSGTHLLLLKLDRRVLLVSQAGSRALRGGASTMSTLCELSDPEDVASILMKVRGEEQSRLAARFQEILAQEDDDATRAMTPAAPAPTPLRTPAPTPRRATLRTQASPQPMDHADPAATLAAARAVALQRRLASAQNDGASAASRTQRSRGVLA